MPEKLTKVEFNNLGKILYPEIKELTADFGHIRWEGDRKQVDRTLGRVEVDKTNEIEMWAKKTKDFLKEADEVFGYFSKYYSGNPLLMLSS